MRIVSNDFTTAETQTERQPSELYHFWRGTTYWRYNSGRTSLTVNSTSYAPVPIERKSIQFNSDLNAHTVQLSVARTLPPMSEYINEDPIDTIWVTIFKIHRDMDPIEKEPIFTGLIRSTVTAGSALVLECVSIEFLLNRQLPRWRYQPGCNHRLYDSWCQVVEASYQVNATLSDISSTGFDLTSATFASQADGYYTLGNLYFGDYKRTIVDHVGSVISIRYKIATLEAEDVVQVSAGCDHTIETCYSKFNNVLNSLAFPYISFDNPCTRW